MTDKTPSNNNNEVSFEELGLPTAIVDAVHDLGFKYATPIQSQAIPYLLQGRDILGLAQTGSGKTASFMLPLLSNLDPKLRAVQILVLTPTRELANQVTQATTDFSKYLPKVNPLAIYGGQSYGQQIRSLKAGAQVVIATPGRLVDHITRETINLNHIKAVVLDEADEMLSMGFADALETILSQIPETAQTALFSATMPKTIESITAKHLKDPAQVKIHKVKGNEPKIDQYYWLQYQYSRDQALIRFLEVESYDAAIIFVKTKQGCNEVCEFLLKNGVAAACLHGDMSQEVRESTLNGLRNESINVLVATDVAARGLDIDRIDLVINYELPNEKENYVHRVGRTGRAGREGRSISFVGERERANLYAIEKACNKELREIKAPTNHELELFRRAKFKKELESKINDSNLENYTKLIDELIPTDYEPNQVLAALLNLATADRKLVLPSERPPRNKFTYDREYYSRARINVRNGRYDNNRYNGSPNKDLYVLNLGRNDNINVKDIIKIINKHSDGITIGNIRINNTNTLIELPKNVSPEVLANVSKDKGINGKPLNLRRFEQNNRYQNNYRRNNDGEYGNRGGRNQTQRYYNNDRRNNNERNNFRSENRSNFKKRYN
ncbi:hypothetical protein CJP74_04120 [Psittacicella melopsittaci]|uniref:DEAD-box ATP-dependent RNA helicase RhpA n=1 Tax=Psittacicella melopsittaci TaxID=2028576 RepID=A0A3A1Y2N9_9GAMM|nr:DEAD/DEAH box helicase [Psittacicella melopsittaci]RIY32572.1 hypothetical protein CJP74_04120 [Psittacicella melopsittaci]